jgi:hypothetical protein
MKRLDNILDMILEGAINLASWSVFLILAGVLFGISAVIGGQIFHSLFAGVLVGLVVVFGGGCLLNQLRSKHSA